MPNRQKQIDREIAGNSYLEDYARRRCASPPRTHYRHNGIKFVQCDAAACEWHESCIRERTAR